MGTTLIQFQFNQELCLFPETVCNKSGILDLSVLGNNKIRVDLLVPGHQTWS